MLQQIEGRGIDESLRVHWVQLLGSCSLNATVVKCLVSPLELWVLSQGDFIPLLFDKKNQ